MACDQSYVELPTGSKMPIIGLGTGWMETDDVIGIAINAALDCGYKHIDTAYSYGNEAAIGKTLKQRFHNGKAEREDIFITSKLWSSHMSSRQEVMRACKLSLERLQLDYLDLYLIHDPVGLKYIDDDTLYGEDENGRLLTAHYDLEEVWKGMEDLVDAGLTKAIGVSNFNSKQIERMCKIARNPVSNVQVECHAYFQQRPLHEFCKQRNITFTAYAPMGSPGRPYDPVDLNPKAPRLLDNPEICLLAEKYKRTPAQILLRSLTQRGIAVIPKSANPQRIQENRQVFEFELSVEDMKDIAKLDKGIRFFELNSESDHPEFAFNEPY